MKSNGALVSFLKARGLIKSRRVRRAFEATDRRHFVPDEHKGQAYEDAPQPIGEGQTISAPHMVAIMTEELKLGKGHRVLEVGSGSGYQAGVIANAIGPGGKVFSIERHAGLCGIAKANCRKAGVRNAFFHHGDGKLGFRANAPYDRIIVTAAAKEIPPALIEQLKEGSTLVMPLGEQPQMATLVAIEKKKGGQLEMKELLGVRFVPLV
ncbi:protein-L-isoaspartate(D-aspartate) O-methyltransferase [Candidatus Micrarchaeota archaeon]|nr:protein-L-isoaspartate(D-aspartate) O-methyltransferase [Candidatus Micrarchaeota archaeon]MBI5177295.1 protein-L-isoaspartate(D-aspartate) O-methyltransferase [Candidatus Micrarchaeota archaeon]